MKLGDSLKSVGALRAITSRPSGVLSGVPAGAVSLIAVWLREMCQKHVVVVSGDPEQVFTDMVTWLPDREVGLFAEADVPPFDRIPPADAVTRHRLSALAMLHG